MEKTSGMAIASLVLGICSILLGWIPIIGWAIIILAIIFGFNALSKIKKDHALRGRGLAIAGIIMGFAPLVIMIILMFIGGLAYFGVLSPAKLLPNKTTATQTTIEKTKDVISSSFFDYGKIYCDTEATTLQKETLFNDNFKGMYVKWTGKVSRVAESFGSYTIQVKHCPNTFTSDIIVTMKDDQKNKLLGLKEDDQVTYIAKLTRFGEIVGLSAEDGEIVS